MRNFGVRSAAGWKGARIVLQAHGAVQAMIYHRMSRWCTATACMHDRLSCAFDFSMKDWGPLFITCLRRYLLPGREIGDDFERKEGYANPSDGHEKTTNDGHDKTTKGRKTDLVSDCVCEKVTTTPKVMPKGLARRTIS